MVIEEEEGRDPSTTGVIPKQELLCSDGYSCVPLEECTIMEQLLKKSCLQTDKLRALTCGYKGLQIMVCCPDSCPSQTPNKPSNQGQCGMPKLNNWWSSNYKGVGAQPWVVRVGFKNKLTNNIDYLCCGSIINRQVILTAAHCALAKTTTHKIATVRVGEYDADNDPDCTAGFCAQTSRDIPLSYIIAHPGYDSKSFRHNIALLVLKEKINYSLAVQPICLYQRVTYPSFSGLRATLVGWGKLFGQAETQPRQQQITLPICPLEQCILLYGSSVPITDNQLCVGGEAGKDACSGFGGAPLVIIDPKYKNKYFQIGLMSFGSDKCGTAGEPSIYTRVDQYADWIKTNLPKEII
ncbi:hypothetical protein O3M35_000872 [Rhynocoris fuscipes]|uniref:CLIP domain-containing serine protease n=1 Tax=Rhynocoris fuscipes TaxID=488301 RepID=A0AAW1DQE1_9HEMI